MINIIREYIEHKKGVSEMCIVMARLLYEDDQNLEAFFLCIESLIALSMIPKLTRLFEIYIYDPLFNQIRNSDDE